MEEILSWPTPRSSTRVRSFHGLAQLMRIFSDICATMNDTIKGGMKTKFIWTKDADEIFERLKMEVATQLAFVVEYEASNIALGEVLIQEGRLVVFF